MPTPWARYVKDITGQAPAADIAATSGIEASALSKWLSGRAVRPRAEQVIKFARAYQRPPGEALVAAGYLRADECGQGNPLAAQQVETMSPEELVAEIERLSLERQRPIIEMVSRFLGRPFENWRPLPRKVTHPARRKIDPGRIEALSDAELLDALTELMSQRAVLMDEVAVRLIHRDGKQMG